MKKNTIDMPVYLFHQGTNYRSYRFLGSRTEKVGRKNKAVFRVWAPRAQHISVVGDFNGWNREANPMDRIADGIWEAKIDGVKTYDNYKYAITTNGRTILKADPFAYHAATAPHNASKFYDLPDYKWRSVEYDMAKFSVKHESSPINIYELNALSWRKNDDGNYYSYRQLAETLVPYVKEMGYTHVEFMPLSEYPFDGSWGYQVTGYFGITSRLGTPEDFMYLIDEFHLAGIGVIMDWVPAHFPKDEHGLYEFDGTYQFEDPRPTRRDHTEWGTRIFDFGRTEIQSFLVSSALFYFDVYHIDGIRVDAVASMLYLDYARKPGEWEPNYQGTNINLEAVAFIQKLNSAVFQEYPYALMMAEESTAYPGVTQPVYNGGLGFNFKWNMGWMNDTLSYIKKEPIYRRYHHDQMTFGMAYAFSESFVLPISHDEVVYGKGSLINKMPGSYEEKFAGVRAFMGFMMSHPGKKLMFMGQEIGQFDEWNYNNGIEFYLADFPMHAALQKLFKDVNHFYKEHDAFWSYERSWDGFEWLIVDDRDANVFAYERRGASGEKIVCVMNFSGETHHNYRIGVNGGEYELAMNSDDEKYGGYGVVKKNCFKTEDVPAFGKPRSICVDLEKLSFMYFIERN